MGKREEQFYYVAAMLVGFFIRLLNSGRKVVPKNILIIKLDEIGDVVNALHVPSLLKRTYPNATITLWVKPFVISLVENDPNISTVVTAPRQLADNYDTIIDLRGSWHSLYHLLFKRPNILLERGRVRLKNKYTGGQPHEVYTNLAVISPLLPEKVEKPELAIYFNKHHVEKSRKFLINNAIEKFAVLHTGARRRLRQWPAERYAAIAGYLKEKKGLAIVFTGDAGDISYIDALQKGIPFQTYSTAGIFSLVESAALFSLASLFIGNESGPMHIAAATGIPVIGLFGPGVPTVFYPYGAHCTYLHHVLPCNPCNQIDCVQPENPCINYISIIEVIEKTNILLPATQ